MEIWKDIQGYEGLYQISNIGKVKRILFINNMVSKPMEKIIKSINNGRGYLYVTLCKNNIHKNHYIHRLVGLEFIDNPQNKKDINHINGNKSDNRVENLEWNTRKENINHARNIGLINDYKKVNQYDTDKNFIKQWNSMEEAVMSLNIHQSCISLCCMGKRKTTGGFIWEYAEQKQIEIAGS